ncbi:MAG: hypothetical protein IJZ87_02615 [Bacteroidales bacterium]|nr:hypothetical protein [Bacteroidales bacterium]
MYFNRVKIIKIFFKSLLFILLGFILLVTAVSLFRPSYSFDEPKPFQGSYLHNPYKDMNPDNWIQSNFHAHTRQFGGLTNGRLNTNEMLDSVYSSLGFEHVGISDYNKINAYDSSNPSYIPAYEHGYGMFKIHQLCIGAEKVRALDYFAFQNLSMKQHTLNRLAKQTRLAIPAHPSFVKKGYLVEDMKYLSNYKLMEVLNGFRISTAHWDMALSNGHLVYLIGNDDSHDVTDITDVATRFTMINAPENETEQLLQALENGNAVGVDFPIKYDETLEQKINRLKKDLPYIKEVELHGDTLFVAASKPFSKIKFIGQEGKVLDVQKNNKSAFYVIQPEDNYVRTELRFKDGTTLYLNPITRHESDEIIKQRLDKINYPKTILLWSVYVLVIAAVIFSQRIKKNSRTSEL